MSTPERNGRGTPATRKEAKCVETLVKGVYSLLDIISKKSSPELSKTKKTLLSSKGYFDVLRIDDENEETG